MGWVWLAVLGIAAMAALLLLRIPRTLWSFVGAGLMLGAAGYALQGSPTLPGHPVVANAVKPPADDPQLTDLRDRMLGKFSADWSYQVAADAMTNSGDPQAAVQVMLGGIRKIPRSMALWTGLGTAYAAHDKQVSPASLFAFRQAARLQPLNPAPPFFLGLALVRANEFARARPLWARALALTPPDVSYRRDIESRLQLLDRYLAAMEAESPPPPR